MVVRPDFEPTRTRSGPGDPDQIYFWPRSRFSGPDRKSTRTRENPIWPRENPIWPREIRSGPEKIRSGPDAKFVWARRSGALWTRFFGDQNQVWPASPTRPPEGECRLLYTVDRCRAVDLCKRPVTRHGCCIPVYSRSTPRFVYSPEYNILQHSALRPPPRRWWARPGAMLNGSL